MKYFVRLETSCALVVERTFAVAFPVALQPVVVARKLVAAFEAGPVPGSRAGRQFVVSMSPVDYARFEPNRSYLERQWETMLAGLAERSRRPQRPPSVVAREDASVARGTVVIAVSALPEPAGLAARVRKGMPPGASALLDRTVVVGRDERCDLVLVDARVSRRHLEFVCDGSSVRFRDLGSVNGTRHNGTVSAGAEVGLGDVVALGDSELAIVPAEDA